LALPSVGGGVGTCVPASPARRSADGGRTDHCGEDGATRDLVACAKPSRFVLLRFCCRDWWSRLWASCALQASARTATARQGLCDGRTDNRLSGDCILADLCRLLWWALVFAGVKSPINHQLHLTCTRRRCSLERPHRGDGSCQPMNNQYVWIFQGTSSRRIGHRPVCVNRYRLARRHGELATALAVPRVRRGCCASFVTCAAWRGSYINTCGTTDWTPLGAA